jgi:tetratricopeptide (TPR) repeat protein
MPPAGMEAGPAPQAQQLASRRPDGRKRWIAAALLVALAAASVWAWLRVVEIRDRLAADAPVVARRSVAVLDLRDLAGRSETAWLSTALSEMLATELSQGGDLRVVPGQNVVRALDDLGLGGRDALDREQKLRLRRRLGADYLVLGSYTALAEGGALRVDLRLEDARGDQTVATVGQNGTQSELFELVGETGAALRRALGAEERRAAAPVLPTSPEAARLYAEGLDALRRFEPRRGRELLEQAVGADPQNALARSALATAWSSLGYAGRAEEEARRARELAADLPVEEGLVVEARYFEAAQEWSRAAEIWERLWSAYPDVGGYGLRVAGCRTQAGQPQQALAAALALRNLPPPEGEDPRIDLAEATAAGALADYRRQADASARAVERAERDGATLIAAEALVVRGWALRNLGRTAEARAAIERGRDQFEERGNRKGVSSADSALGGVLSDLGEPEAAQRAFERSLTVARELGDRGAEALALNNLAVLARNRGENEVARASYERTVALFEETGNRRGAAFAANNLAVCLTELGEFSEAGRRATSALSTWRESGDKGGLAAALGTLGGVRRRTGELSGAADAWREALALRRETGQRPGEAVALNGLGTTLLESGDLAGAQGHFAAAETLARELGAKSSLASALVGLSEVASARAEPSAALSALAEAQSLRRELGQRAGVARLRVSVARLDLESDPDAAAGAAREVLAAPREERTPEVEAAARIVAARALVAGGDRGAARELLTVPGLAERLATAQRFGWRIASALAASAGDRLAAQAEIGAVRREAAAAGFVPAELDAALAELSLTGAGGAELAARARAAGYEALALRAARRTEER